MSTRKDGPSKKILKTLAEKPAMPLDNLKSQEPQETYALNRAVKNLIDSGHVELLSSVSQDFVRITKKGRTKLNTYKLKGSDALVPQVWDGYWRIIILDLDEERKSERESLRYLLKKAGFVNLKNSAWISPYPYEHLFTNIKKDLGLTTEMMIIVTEFVDAETQKFLFESFGRN